MFIDEATITVRAGKGGRGCVAFRREKFVPRGGPSGGDGGDGGSVVLVGDENLNTLYHLRNRGLYAAERGAHGEGSNRTGRRGGDLEIPVPLGTQLAEAAAETPRGEILRHGERLIVAKGGRGGRGNARFTTATRQTPRYAEDGGEGEELELRLELKLIADVGLVGLPNAGKSTLIGALSAAKPKIADYPFTTLAPRLGVVARGLDEPFVMADLPGLIAGAAAGAGLGIQFLRHVERCRVLAHLVDLSGSEGSEGSEGTVRDHVATIEAELEAFDPSLLRRRLLLVGSKLDAADPSRVEDLRALAAEREQSLVLISAVTGAGLRELTSELAAMLAVGEHETAEH